MKQKPAGCGINQTYKRKLHGRTVKVIGLGGIGSPVAQAVAQFLSFRGENCSLWLIDGDRYEERNRERVVFDGAGENKALVKARELSAACDGRLPVVPVPRYVTPSNSRRLIEEHDIVFLCVDNHASRKLAGNRCRRLDNVVLISGGNDGIENGKSGTFGNVQVYIRENGRDRTNPITRFHPEIARPRDKRPDELGCADLAHAAPQLLFTNIAVASAMLGVFHTWLTGTMPPEEVFLDLARTSMTTARRRVQGKREADNVTS